MDCQFFILITILCQFEITGSISNRIVQDFYLFEHWERRGFRKLHTMVKDVFRRDPDYDPCVEYELYHNDPPTVKISSTFRTILKSSDEYAITLDGPPRYFIVPCVLQCIGRNPDDNFNLIVTGLRNPYGITTEKVYEDGTYGKSRAYAAWWVIANRTIRETYEEPANYETMAKWYQIELSSRQKNTCEILNYGGLTAEYGTIYKDEIYIITASNHIFKVPGKLTCSYKIPHGGLDVRHYIATISRTKWIRVRYVGTMINNTGTYTITL